MRCLLRPRVHRGLKGNKEYIYPFICLPDPESWQEIHQESTFACVHLEAISTEPVLVDDGNLSDSSLERSVQKGLKAFALEVEPGGDVAVDFLAWAFLLQVLDLSLQILFLVVGGDSGVADALLLFFLDVVVGHAKELLEVLQLVETLRGSGHTNGLYLMLSLPSDEGLSRDVILTSDCSGSDIG